MTATVTQTPTRVSARTLADRLARHLAGWTLDSSDADDMDQSAARMIGPDGASLWIRVDRNRAEVSGRFPMTPAGRCYCPEKDEYGRISFDATREPTALAREVGRRCLAVYLPALAKAKTRIAAEDKARRDAVAMMARIANRFPEAGEPRQQNDGSLKLWHLPRVYCLTVTPHDEGPRATFQIEGVTEGLAVDVLERLRAEP